MKTLHLTLLILPLCLAGTAALGAAPPNSATKGAKPSAGKKPTVTAEALAREKADVAAGKQLYLQNCMHCHGESGRGDGPAAAAMAANKPRNLAEGKYKYGSTPEAVLATITNGVKDTAMPPWKHLPEEERKKIVKFVLSLSKGK